MSENISLKMGVKIAAAHHSIWVRIYVEKCIYIIIYTKKNGEDELQST